VYAATPCSFSHAFFPLPSLIVSDNAVMTRRFSAIREISFIATNGKLIILEDKGTLHIAG